jgi:DnaJ domain
MAIDPYRVLGVPPGASVAEVKRAYRRLAKANHPDSAGAAALPRFLQIQRAYEQLTSPTWRPGTRRPASASPAEPWRADPSRARSTPGAQRPGGPAGEARGSRSAGGGPKRGRSAGAGTAGGGPGRSKAGTAAGPAGPAGPDAPGGRRRPTKKATFGSTTYDEARETADTRWSGASWYGPSSGEYWRVNPREYADPRKHGPEYLARAAARAAEAAQRRAAEDAAAPSPGADDRGAPPSPRPPRPRPDEDRAPGARAAHREQAGAAPHGAAETRARREWTPRPRAEDESSIAPPLRRPGSFVELSPPARRLLRAAVAWPPLGIAAAAVIGEATGCAAFEATCTAPEDVYPWIAQAAILVGLLALPGVARVLAGGTIAVAVLAFPVVAVLAAGGANYDPTYGPAALITVLAVVWVLGVGAAITRRALMRSLP